MKKNIVYFIRHAEAEHNIFYRKYGFFPNTIDTKLTENGINQCKQLQIDNIDNIYVSPLSRTLQTATLLFPDKKYTALDQLRETDFSHKCNTRSNKSELVDKFKNCNFDMITENDEIIMNYNTASNKDEYNEFVINNHINYIKELIQNSTGKTIVFVSHNDYLVRLLKNMNVININYLKNCEVLRFDNFNAPR